MEITVEYLRLKRKEYQELALKYIDDDSNKHTYYLGKTRAITDLISTTNNGESKSIPK